MAKNKKIDNTLPTVPKKRDKWCGCFLVVGIILLVLFIAAIAIGLGIGDKVLRQNFDIGIRDCFKIVAGIGNADEDDIVTDPATDDDTEELYGDLRGVLFLNDNVDMGALVDDLLGSMGSGSGEPSTVRTSPQEEQGGQPLDVLTELYSEENVDYTRMRQFINGEKQIDDVYDQEFVLRIQGNSFAGLINDILRSSITSEEGGEDVSVIVDNISVRQISFSKRGQDPVITVIIKINVEEIANKYVADLSGELEAQGVPSWVISMVKNAIPEKLFISADLVMSEPASLNLRINSISDEAMNKAFDLIYKISDGETDLKATLNGAVEEMMGSLRTEMPILFELVENQENGRVKLDAFGLIADLLNDNVSAEEGEDLTGRDLVAFLAGVIGSDAEIAIEERLNDDQRYADSAWQTTNADALVSAMADSFSLAKSYFVNGTDENGDKIISVENGEVIGVDKMFGRVYSDASGQLYYKRQGGSFKIFVNGDKQVLGYAKDGYEAFYSTQLHYTANDKDYTLYRNGDNSVIYGVAVDGSVMEKNGTYTELTTFYVDEGGNVYSRQNAANTYIECKKETLTVDVVMSIANSQDVSLDDILKYVDKTALKLNGVGAWNNPIEITDIQFAAIAGDMLTKQLEGGLGAADPKIRYAVLTEKDGHNFVTVGIQLNTAGLLGEEMASFSGLLGETLYIEMVCDITIGLEEGEYVATKVVYNDLSQEYTDRLLNSIAKVVPDMNLNGILEDVSKSVREVISSLNENMPIEFGNGVIKLSSPLDLIKPMLLGENSDIDNQQFVESINNLLHSDGNVAVAGVHATDIAYASESWKTENVNSFVTGITGSLGLKSESFLKDGSSTDYSVTKVMDIVRAEDFGINSVLDDLDYDLFKSEGFACWSENIEITDAQLAAVVSEMKDDLASDLNDAGIEIEYAHVSVENGKDFITIGVTAQTSSLLGGNGLDSFMDVIGDTLYAQLKVDVTVGATEYAPTEIILNDLTKTQTDGLIDLIKAIDESIDISSTFSSVEQVLRDVIADIDSTLSVQFDNGKITMGKAQDLIFDAIYTDVEGYTSDEMVEALTLLATSSGYADTIVAPTENYESYWNNVLSEKYFITSMGINELFNSMTGGEDIYTTLKGDFTALKSSNGFVDSNNLYRHRTLEDASFKANSAQLTWLMRANVDSLLGNLLSNPDMFGDVDFVKTEVIKNASNVPGIAMTLTIPTASVISEAGVTGDTQSLVTNLLGERIVLDISWIDEEGSDTVITLNGMTEEETVKFNKMVYKLTGINLFDKNVEGYDQSVVNKVCNSVRGYFGDYFVLGYDEASDSCYVTMDNLYALIAEQAFPEAEGKDALTDQQVLEVMQNLYELPETAGQFDSAKLGDFAYVSNPEHEEDVAPYVKSAGGHSYEVVGALESVNSATQTIEMYVTVKYELSFGGEASDMMPDHIYITLHCTATPKLVGGSIDLDIVTEVVYNHEHSDEDLAMNDALAYYGIDIDAAVEQEQDQIKNYLLNQHF